jgi:tetratricopeptide (TPR) repeat protein
MKQLLVLLIFASVFGSSGMAQAGHRSKKSVPQPSGAAAVIQQAKVIMTQGNRAQALELLDQARKLSRSKTEQREIAIKRTLFTEQFLTSDSFQAFQEAKALAEAERWDECLRELEGIKEKDKDNLLVLRLKAEGQSTLKQYDAAAKSFMAVLALVPGDLSASFGQVELALAQKQSAQGLALLGKTEPRLSADIERLVILRAKLLEQSERVTEATDLLREDQESHLDHTLVIYELGMIYTRVGGHDWQARKMLSLFITRCKRMKEADLKSRRLEPLLLQAQTALVALDKKLGV